MCLHSLISTMQIYTSILNFVFIWCTWIVLQDVYQISFCSEEEIVPLDILCFGASFNLWLVVRLCTIAKN